MNPTVARGAFRSAPGGHHAVGVFARGRGGLLHVDMDTVFPCDNGGFGVLGRGSCDEDGVNSFGGEQGLVAIAQAGGREGPRGQSAALIVCVGDGGYLRNRQMLQYGGVDLGGDGTEADNSEANDGRISLHWAQ